MDGQNQRSELMRGFPKMPAGGFLADSHVTYLELADINPSARHLTGKNRSSFLRSNKASIRTYGRQQNVRNFPFGAIHLYFF